MSIAPGAALVGGAALMAAVLASPTAARDRMVTRARRDQCAAIARGQITEQGVGPLRLGGRVSAVRATCALRDTALVVSPGVTERAHAVPGASILVLSTGTLDTSAVRILIRGVGPRTAMGVGVGSAIAELRAAYDSVCVQSGSGRAIVTSPRLRGVSFAIDRPRPSGVAAGAVLPSSNLAPWDSARVTEIAVHGKPLLGCRAA